MVSLPSASARSRTTTRVCSLVCGVRMTSSSCCAGTGLKKCIPTKRSLWASGSASAASDSELVFVARTAVREMTSSMLVSRRIFSSGISGTASITRSQLANAVRSVLAASGARVSTAGRLSLLRCSAPSRLARTRPTARFSAESSTSTRTVSIPAARRTWTMPDPIVPPPSTPTRVNVRSVSVDMAVTRLSFVTGSDLVHVEGGPRATATHLMHADELEPHRLRGVPPDCIPLRY